MMNINEGSRMDKNELIVDMDMLDSIVQDQGRTRTWIAKTCKVSRGQVSYWFNGDRNMTRENIEDLAQKLGIPVEELLL